MDSISPLSRLPLELLGEIFCQYSAQCPDAPLVLSLVSRTFREVVVSTPCVWKRLRLRTTQGEDGAAEKKGNLWFSMIGSCMVDVELEINAPSVPGLFPLQTPSPSFGISTVLHDNIKHIRSLDIRAPSELDVRILLQAVYGDDKRSHAAVPDIQDSPFSLEDLAIQISSSTPHSLRTTSPAVLPVLHLPKLRSLSLKNHSISFLASCSTFNELQHLSITCPIRFTPISLHSILDVLRNSPRLETLSIESRMVDGPSPGSYPSITSSPEDPYPASPTAPQVHAATTSQDDISDQNELQAASSSLIHLPYLTRLSLRVNIIPSFLSHLLLPNLHTLHIDDLNGKRAGSALETGIALRQLLVRMELPNEFRRPGAEGLQVLELAGVNFVDGKEEIDVWDWCLKRMKVLKTLSIANGGSIATIVEMLTPKAIANDTYPAENFNLPAGGHPQQHAAGFGSNDLACPCLHTLKLTHNAVPLNLERLRDLRPSIKVDVEVVHDPFVRMATMPAVDYLSLYADMPSRSTAPSPAPSSNPTTPPNGRVDDPPSGSRTPTQGRKIPRFPHFGPWLVLAQPPEGDDKDAQKTRKDENSSR